MQMLPSDSICRRKLHRIQRVSTPGRFFTVARCSGQCVVKSCLEYVISYSFSWNSKSDRWSGQHRASDSHFLRSLVMESGLFGACCMLGIGVRAWLARGNFIPGGTSQRGGGQAPAFRVARCRTRSLVDIRLGPVGSHQGP